MFQLCGENDKIVRNVYVGLHSGSHLVGRLKKRWIDTTKDGLKKRCFDVKEARITVDGGCL